jgi:DNA-binding NarL/FixJ family response regulator
MKRKRVYLVVPSSIIRLSVAEWLRTTPDLAVCGQSDNIDKARGAIARAKPDVMVTEMFSQEDFNSLQFLHREFPRLPILIYCCGDETWGAARVLEAGGNNYTTKMAKVSSLIDGIRRALARQKTLSSRARYCLRAGRSKSRFSKRAGSDLMNHLISYRLPRRRAD